MKKQYTKPAAQAVILFAEECLLAGSPIQMYDTDSTGDTGGSDALSAGKAWSSDNWTAGEE